MRIWDGRARSVRPTRSIAKVVTVRTPHLGGERRLKGASTPGTLRSKTFRFTAIGVAATTLCVGSAGFVVAANPASAFGQAVGAAVHAAGVDWSDMPEGYTQAQYEAFWGAEYSGEDLVELQALWSLDETETKSRASQMVLDGEELPPGRGHLRR